MTEPEDHVSEAPETAEAPTAQHPPIQPPVQPPVPPLAQPAPFAGQPYPPGYVAPYPFAPVAKEPWFNPAKRTTILITSIVAALVLLGGGILIGATSSGDHHDRERGFTIYGPMQAPGGGSVVGPRFHIVPGPGKHGRGNGAGNGAGNGQNAVPTSPQTAPSSSGTATS